MFGRGRVEWTKWHLGRPSNGISEPAVPTSLHRPGFNNTLHIVFWCIIDIEILTTAALSVQTEKWQCRVITDSLMLESLTFILLCLFGSFKDVRVLPWRYPNYSHCVGVRYDFQHYFKWKTLSNWGLNQVWCVHVEVGRVKNIFYHLLLMVSSHTNWFGFIFWGIQTFSSETCQHNTMTANYISFVMRRALKMTLKTPRSNVSFLEINVVISWLFRITVFFEKCSV